MSKLTTYKEFAPTPFDGKGAFLPDRSDWVVVPVSRTRDSGPLAESNFAAALDMLGGESEIVEVHRFGHWGPGWFEIILVDPDTSAVDTAIEIASSLEDYPVLDEMDLGERELEAAYGYWADCLNLGDRVDLCRERGASIFAARRTDEIPDECLDYVRDRAVS